MALQAFRKGGDIFQELAGQWLGGAGPVEREKTKRIVYSVMYGAGAQKLAEYLQVPFSEASGIIASFVGQYLRNQSQNYGTRLQINIASNLIFFPINYKITVNIN